jgi:hypothetical protein
MVEAELPHHTVHVVLLHVNATHQQRFVIQYWLSQKHSN